jgi:hypothetical protein
MREQHLGLGQPLRALAYLIRAHELQVGGDRANTPDELRGNLGIEQDCSLDMPAL